MNAKCVVALILVLQVSMSLCEIPPPSQDVDETYTRMRDKILRTGRTHVGNLHMAAETHFQERYPDKLEAARNYLRGLVIRPEVKAVVKVAEGVGREAGPLVEQLRSKMLGLYEYYLRPHVRPYLERAINQLKPYLDNDMSTDPNYQVEQTAQQ